MANNKNKEKKRIILLVLIGSFAFIVSIWMNIVGMKNAINKETDSSGMAGFSVRAKKTDDLDNNKETKINNKEKIIEEDLLVSALPIIKLNNNNWDRIKANFSGFKLDEEGNVLFENKGYKFYCNGSFVNYIIFDETYKDEVVGHIKVGEDLKEIKKKLGKPTFKLVNGLGYKTKEVYVFFYENEIVVYPNMKYSNYKLEELLNNYANKIYQNGRTHFLVELRNNYKDFNIEMDENENTVKVISTARQITANLDSIGNIEVEFYNNYKFENEETNKLIKEGRYITKEEDLVKIFEDERVSGK